MVCAVSSPNTGSPATVTPIVAVPTLPKLSVAVSAMLSVPTVALVSVSVPRSLFNALSKTLLMVRV